MFGLVGGPLIFASAIAVLFGAYEQDGAHFLFSIPEIVFEFSITIYTIVKGFRPSPILDDTRYAGVGEASGSAARLRRNRSCWRCQAGVPHRTRHAARARGDAPLAGLYGRAPSSHGWSRTHARRRGA